MRKILLPIDPAATQRTLSAVSEAVRLYREEPVVVHLLRVQPRVTGHVAMFFGASELRQLQQEEGAEDLKYARSLLEAAGVPYTSAVVIGRSAQTIARIAREQGCDGILFGEEGTGLAGKVFGTLAQQVRQLLGGGECQVIGS